MRRLCFILKSCLSWLLFSMLWQIPAQSSLREKGLVVAHGLQVQSIKTGESQRQEHEAAGHIVPRLGNRWRWMACAQLAFSFHSVGDPSQWDGATHIWIGLPTLIKSRSQLSQTCLEVCLHDDFRANNIDNQNYPSRCLLKMLLYDSICAIIWESQG